MGLKSSFFNHEWMLLSCVQRKNRNISGDIPIFLFSILRTTLTSFPYLLLLLQFYPWRVACKTALHNLVLSYCVTFRYVKPPIFTLCVGNAWGEAALLLAAGAKGNRSALPSSTIMIKQVRFLNHNSLGHVWYARMQEGTELFSFNFCWVQYLLL